MRMRWSNGARPTVGVAAFASGLSDATRTARAAVLRNPPRWGQPATTGWSVCNTIPASAGQIDAIEYLARFGD